MGYLLLSLLLVGGEWLIKSHIERSAAALPRELAGGRIRLCRYHNRGLVLGILQVKRWLPPLIATVVGAFFIGLTLPLLLGDTVLPLSKLGLALLYAGAVSNLLDRYIRGYVVDYFSLPRLPWRKIARLVFNLADFWIFIGIVLFSIGMPFI